MNRVAAEGEEIVVDPDALDPKDLRPNAGQRPLDRRARRRKTMLGGFVVRPHCTERCAIDLPVWRHRERVEDHEGGRDHVRGERLSQGGAQGVRAAVFPDDVPDEAGAFGFGFDEHGGRPDGGAPLERMLDLSELDPVSSDLDLVVDSGAVIECPVVEDADAVSGSVPPRLLRSGDELLLGQFGPCVVAASQASAADPEFSGNADRDPAFVGVENVERRSTDGAADRNGGTAGVSDSLKRGVDGALGRAVSVPQRLDASKKPLRQRRRERLASATQPQR